MVQRKLDLLVVLCVVAVVLVGGVINLLTPLPLSDSTWIEDLGDEIAIGMSLGQVWELWGAPDATALDVESHVVVYTWWSPWRQVELHTGTKVWRVIDYSGYIGQLSP